MINGFLGGGTRESVEITPSRGERQARRNHYKQEKQDALHRPNENETSNA